MAAEGGETGRHPNSIYILEVGSERRDYKEGD